MTGDPAPGIRIAQILSANGQTVVVLGEPLKCTACDYATNTWIVPIAEPTDTERPARRRPDPGA